MGTFVAVHKRYNHGMYSLDTDYWLDSAERLYSYVNQLMSAMIIYNIIMLFNWRLGIVP